MKRDVGIAFANLVLDSEPNFRDSLFLLVSHVIVMVMMGVVSFGAAGIFFFVADMFAMVFVVVTWGT